jgi:hypothetical protein
VLLRTDYFMRFGVLTVGARESIIFPDVAAFDVLDVYHIPDYKV